MTEKKIKILIVDDHPVFRTGLKFAINFLESAEIIGETDDGEEAIELTKKILPEIILLDISINSKSGLIVANELYQTLPEVKIIFLTMHKEEDIINAAFRSGASAYLLKDDAMDEINNAIASVLNNEKYISKTLNNFKIPSAVKEHDLDLLKIQQLTKKEREILKLIGEAKTSREIADQLFCSIRTIDNHRANICAKLNLSGNNAIVKFAIKHRLLI
ncbi:MAG: response regulator transcription factor [Ignavibacteria bacterium]|jgi:NarL family two-component system response regulator LiaR